MKRFILIIFICCLMNCSHTKVKINSTAYITSLSGTYIKYLPSLQSGNVYHLEYRDAVQILGEKVIDDSLNHQKKHWYQVQYQFNNQISNQIRTGWILDEFLSAIIPPVLEEKYTTAISGLVLREKPSKDSKKITLIRYNTKISIIEYSNFKETINGINSNWARIIFYENYINQAYTGWVFNGFLNTKVPESNKNLINKRNFDLETTLRLLDHNFMIFSEPGGFYFDGTSKTLDKNIISISVSVGCEDSKMLSFKIGKNQAEYRVKHDQYDTSEIDNETTRNLRPLKSDYYKCIITKDIVIDGYNGKKNLKINCSIE